MFVSIVISCCIAVQTQDLFAKIANDKVFDPSEARPTSSEIRRQYNVFGESLLAFAVRIGRIDAAKKLLRLGVEPDMESANSRLSPLEMAFVRSDPESFRLIMEYGSSNHSYSQLEIATFLNDSNTVRRAVSSDENRNWKDFLDIAVHGRSFDVIDLLLPHCEDQVSPLEIAIFGRNPLSIRAVVQENFEPLEGVDRSGLFSETPVMLACRLGDRKALEILLEYGYDLNASHYQVGTALFIAVNSGDTDLASQLLEHGASVNAMTADEYTPLMKATYYGDLPMVELLLKYGANSEFQRADGTNALQIAVDSKLDAIAIALKSGKPK